MDGVTPLPTKRSNAPYPDIIRFSTFLYFHVGRYTGYCYPFPRKIARLTTFRVCSDTGTQKDRNQ